MNKCSNAISAKLPHTGSSCPDIKYIHMSVPVRPGPMLWTSRRFKSGSKQKQKFDLYSLFGEKTLNSLCGGKNSLLLLLLIVPHVVQIFISCSSLPNCSLKSSSIFSGFLLYSWLTSTIILYILICSAVQPGILF